MSQLSIPDAFSLRANWHFTSAVLLLIKKSGCITGTSSTVISKNVVFIPMVWALAVVFPAGPREHRFHRSGELHQLGGAPWAAAGPVQTGHAVSPGPEQWRGTGVLPGAHRAGEWKPDSCTQIQMVMQRESHEAFPHGTNFHMYTHFCWISERLQNWFRQSRRAPQRQKLTPPFRSLSCKRRINLFS